MNQLIATFKQQLNQLTQNKKTLKNGAQFDYARGFFDGEIETLRRVIHKLEQESGK